MGRRGWACALACVLGATTGAEAKGKEALWVEGHRMVRPERWRMAQVAKSAVPAVVAITARHAAAPGQTDAEEEPQRELGAGFIIRSDGLILTSSHVIEKAVDITVSLYAREGSFEELPARLLGQDEQSDLALLKVDAGRKLPVLKLGSANNVDLADWVVVIGNPFGLAQTVSVGVVSYKGRADVVPEGRTGYFDYLQTDAAINPGSSGGPVLDERGEVVAIANAVNVSGQGIGFAVPIDMAKAILPQLYAYGSVRRGWLGASVVDLSGGVLVSRVAPHGPAARAGLSPGDVIVGFNRQKVDRADRLRWRLTASGEGRTVALTVRRQGRLKRVRVHLEAPPEEAEPTPSKLLAEGPQPSPATSGAAQAP